MNGVNVWCNMALLETVIVTCADSWSRSVTTIYYSMTNNVFFILCIIMATRLGLV